jgi:HemY protein
MRHQTAAADWDAALATLSGATDGRILDKRTARRHRAVILTAKAIEKEQGEPDVARAAAQEAHDLASDLVPAAVVAGRLFARQGDVRRATRILEAAWRTSPHPDIADAYMHVRAGDSAIDRLKRAETLFRMRPLADEGRHAVARASIDARDFSRARDVIEPILTQRPTQRALMLMADLEEAETGDRGRARGWMARAVYAPRDPVWTADGVVLEDWAPISPVSGKLDAVEWKVPLAEIEGPRLEIDKSEVMALPPVESGGREESAGGTEVAPGSSSSPGPSADEPVMSWPPRVSLVAKASSREPVRPGAGIEPPRPDDPGVAPPDEKTEERRSNAL